MDYTLALYIERIPGSVIRRVTVGGIEQQCLCIPLDSNVFHMTRAGARFLQVVLKEKENPYGTETHYVRFSYPDYTAKDRENRGRRYGSCRMDQPKEMNKDDTQDCDFVGYGTICLDEIPEDAISTAANGKRYVKILAKPMAKKDRGGNQLIIAVNPEYGADHGRRASLANGFDAPLVELGRMRRFDPESADRTGNESSGCDAPVDGSAKHDLGDYQF